MSDTVDIEKYQGRTPGYWSVTSIRDGSIPWNTADEELCADAPLLLEEIKRLRQRLRDATDLLTDCEYYICSGCNQWADRNYDCENCKGADE